ncbi:lysozyme [Acinetobacter sp. AS167]|uniref:lysozyme n=1 Tax=Acinetobacter sp. AS167 TaxID=3127884 RepID=UPI0030176459
MKTSNSGIDLIKGFEDLRLKAYDDGVGVWTIGYGTTAINGIAVKKSDTCTAEQAKSYMAQDLRKFESAVNTALKVPLNQNQFDALVSLTYNIGISAFKSSTLLKKLNVKDYKGAAEQFPRWNRGGGRVLNGLIKRRKIEMELFLK